MLSLSLVNMKVLPYSMFRCVVRVRRLENVRSLFFLTLSENKINYTVNPNLRYLTTKKDESPSAPSSSSSSSSSSESSSSDSSSDEEDEESQKNSESKGDEKKASSSITNQKLQNLLKSMIEPNSKEGSVSSMLLNETLKQDAEKKSSKFVSSKKVEEKSEILGKNLENAAQKVAESLGGDVQKTESELLSRLLSRNAQAADNSKKASINLSELIVGMKIDRTPASSPPGHSYLSNQRLGGKQLGVKEKFVPSRERQQRSPQRSIEPRIRSRISEPPVDLFGGEKLGIFDPSLEYISQPPLKTWQNLHQRAMSLSVTHPPDNYFEEMILWTEKGMLWKFPINNEQGLEEEAKVPFSEHVFLEKHLVPWCPNKGPIRHFMELVCVGLSKNSYLKVEEKKETILWYRDYFEKKSDTLKNAGLDFEAKVEQIEAQ